MRDKHALKILRDSDIGECALGFACDDSEFIINRNELPLKHTMPV